jgi:hypothetical protein
MIFRGTLQLNQPLAWLYIVAQLVGSASAIVGNIDWAATRPASSPGGPTVPPDQAVWRQQRLAAGLRRSGGFYLLGVDLAR